MFPRMTGSSRGGASAVLSWFLLFSAVVPSEAASAFLVPWSEKKFGPDGPWQAVSITVGANDSSVPLASQNVTALSVYPGGEWNSMTFGSAACSGDPGPTCGEGGTWDFDESSNAQHIQWQTEWLDAPVGVNVEDVSIYPIGITIGDTTVYNASVGNSDSVRVLYPNGRTTGAPIGYLSLGAEEEYQFFTLGTSGGIQAWLFPGYLYNTSVISSYSYGLHIGSASFDYPGSLMFGGYNKGRVIPPVAEFRDSANISLLDVNIGVAIGESPFNFTSKGNLLSGWSGNITIEPRSPYLTFPRSVCDTIVSNLPVVWDADLNYYIWNTQDSNYSRVVSSPAYLGFTFPVNSDASNSRNLTIKVPFSLLNLTLDKPIVDTPRQYFPCLPYEGTPTLGRAFLQAAFIGRDWESKTSYLAQAPGPGEKRQGLGDFPTDGGIVSGYESSNQFTNSWRGHWTVLGNDPGSGENLSGLSTGAKAGIGVGAAVGAIALFALAFFLWRRWKKNNAAKSKENETAGNAQTYHDEAQKDLVAQQQYAEAPYLRSPTEMPLVQDQPVELAGSHGVRSELQS